MPAIVPSIDRRDEPIAHHEVTVILGVLHQRGLIGSMAGRVSPPWAAAG